MDHIKPFSGYPMLKQVGTTTMADHRHLAGFDGQDARGPQGSGEIRRQGEMERDRRVGGQHPLLWRMEARTRLVETFGKSASHLPKADH
jgi:hypothetical protein